MEISDKNIRFTFYLDKEEYIVYSLLEEINFNDDLYFAKRNKKTNEYENLSDIEYDKALKEYKEYLNLISEEDD